MSDFNFQTFNFGLTAAARAQETTPNKPIKFIVPYPAGAGNDILARMVGQKMSEKFGQPVVVENRPGAAGNIGLDYLARAPGDGYSIAIADTGPLAINTSLYTKLSFSPTRDFAAVASLVTFTYLLVVNPEVKAESVGELVALARAQPGKINYASVGSGSVVHLATEMFRGRTDIAITHVPYKASPEALQSVVANQTQMMFVNVQAAAPLIKAGKLRALAIVHPTRSPLFPNLPTIAEAGISGYHFTAWFGIVAPSAVPKPIITALNYEINRIMALPDVRERLANMGGVEVVTGTPERFGALIQSETETWENWFGRLGRRLIDGGSQRCRTCDRRGCFRVDFRRWNRN